jgi:hypothetical protein
VADGNDKRRARLNIISHILDQIPYATEPTAAVTLPPRQEEGDYREPDRRYHRVPAQF